MADPDFTDKSWDTPAWSLPNRFIHVSGLQRPEHIAADA